MSGSGRTSILVIDDAPATLGLLDDMLDQAGYRVLMAQSAEAGLTVLRRALAAGAALPQPAASDLDRPGRSLPDACARDAPLASCPLPNSSLPNSPQPNSPQADPSSPGAPTPGAAPADACPPDAVLPDLILIDAVMPGLGGLEACQRIKADPALAAIPVIVMTGLSEPEHVVRAFEAGASDYLTKPLQLGEVLARLGVHLLASRRTRAAHRALDGAGRFLLAVAGDGQLLWATPQAASLLASEAWRLDPRQAARLASGAAAPGEALPALGGLRLTFIGRVTGDELLLRVAPERVAPELLLRERLDLTQREAQVLLWIGRGKPSRDIAEILGLSPRTVDKHLEQIYNKLGIGNRAAAASTAARILGEADLPPDRGQTLS